MREGEKGRWEFGRHVTFDIDIDTKSYEKLTGWIGIAIFCIKWAQFGITDIYDKAFAGLYCVAQFYFGWCYLKAGIKEPVVPLWGIPALVGVSLLV